MFSSSITFANLHPTLIDLVRQSKLCKYMYDSIKYFFAFLRTVFYLKYISTFNKRYLFYSFLYSESCFDLEKGLLLKLGLLVGRMVWRENVFGYPK